MSAAVQTSAPLVEPDMFDDGAHNELIFEIHGELIEDASVRVKLVGVDARPLPVLCMDLKPLSGSKRTIHAGQVFSEATREQAERKAATLKKGAHVTLTTTFQDVHTVLPHVQAVDLHPSSKAHQ